jgi:hypothetical protein
VDTERPRLLPPVAVQLAAHTLQVAGMLDDDDPDQKLDRRLLWWCFVVSDRAN